eukprot:4561262-Pyramimonas_sp.AAC.1
MASPSALRPPSQISTLQKPYSKEELSRAAADPEILQRVEQRMLAAKGITEGSALSSTPPPKVSGAAVDKRK